MALGERGNPDGKSRVLKHNSYSSFSLLFSILLIIFILSILLILILIIIILIIIIIILSILLIFILILILVLIFIFILILIPSSFFFFSSVILCHLSPSLFLILLGILCLLTLQVAATGAVTQ